MIARSSCYFFYFGERGIIKYMKRANVVILAIIGLSFLIGAYFYGQMPEIMASHWNEQGQVNGYMPKFWALFMMPLMSLVLFLFFLIIPKIDPLKANIEKFRNYFDTFIVLMIGFLFYVYLLTIFWNLNWTFNMNLLMLPAIAVLFFYISILLQNAKRNWFIGIRTPWTLSSDNVWEKTHKLASKLFKILAVVMLTSIFFGNYAVVLILVSVFSATIYLIVYSYLEFQKECG